MSIVEIIVDLIPVGLAIIAASIMLVAQLSWLSSNVFENRLVDLSFANYLWTAAFNSLTMIVFILMSRKRAKDECKDCKNTA